MNTLIRTGIIIILFTHYWVNTTISIHENRNEIYQYNEFINIDNISEIPFFDTLLDNEIKETKVWLRLITKNLSFNLDTHFISEIQFYRYDITTYNHPIHYLLTDLPPPGRI